MILTIFKRTRSDLIRCHTLTAQTMKKSLMKNVTFCALFHKDLYKTNIVYSFFSPDYHVLFITILTHFWLTLSVYLLKTPENEVFSGGIKWEQLEMC